MFVYMSKKIAIPKQSIVTCIAWNRSAGYIAVGGEDGMLKVLKLESTGSGNLSMNLSLEGHTGRLQVAVWNEIHQKLTTSDEHGVIIVWMLYKGSWYEEMINNRNKSTVSGMAWSSDGQKICIAYEDGAVIVGSVDGSRVWGKDIKGGSLTAVQWSPDNAMLLFAFSNGDLHLYDAGGNFLTSMSSKGGPPNSEIISLLWYPGITHPNNPVLGICYRNGYLQLMRNHNDDAVIVVDTGLQIVDSRWNHDGSILAIAGTNNENSNLVQFFNCFGEVVRTLPVASGSLRSISWSARSLRLAVAVDSFIYFAAVKTNRARAYFDDSLAYKSSHDSVTFWDLSTHESVVVSVPGVVALAGSDEYCVIATPRSIIVSNKLGIQCDAKQVNFNILHVAINNKGTVIAASKHCFLIWKFSTPSRQGMVKLGGTEVLYDKNCKPIIDPAQEDGDKNSICAIACSDVHVIIATRDCRVALFSLLNQTRITTLTLPARIEVVEINCNSSKFCAIDSSGTLYVRGTSGEEAGVAEPWGARTAWCAKWALDNSRHLAVCDKARLYVLKDGQPEEPLTANGYLCEFKDLEIVTVRLDDITDKHSSEFIVRTEVKSLRDTRQLIEKVGLKEAEAFIKDNPHPKLWQLLAVGALRRVEAEGALGVALGAFVRRGDMLGLRLARRVAALHSPKLQKAEVLAYFGDADAAEKIYLEEDRRDLAVAMRERRGDWFRLAELMKSTPNANVTKLYDRIAEYYADRHNWKSAAEYYKMSNNIDGLKRCYYALDDVEALQGLTKNSPLKRTSGTIPARAVQSPAPTEASPAAIAHLRDEGRLQQAADVAKQLAQSEAAENASPLKIKKLFVLAANLYALNSVEGAKCPEAVECFSSAAAQHWLGMTVTRATSKSGRSEPAMRAAARLATVTASLHPNQLVQAWSAIALISADARAFATCSKAFQQLDALETESRSIFESLAIDIFSRHTPKDPKSNRAECPNCKTAISDWATSCQRCETEFPGCTVSGRPLLERHTIWKCRSCRQCVARQDAVLRQACPVCHSPIST